MKNKPTPEQIAQLRETLEKMEPSPQRDAAIKQLLPGRKITLAQFTRGWVQTVARAALGLGKVHREKMRSEQTKHGGFRCAKHMRGYASRYTTVKFQRSMRDYRNLGWRA